MLAGSFADRGQGGYGFDRSDYMAGDRDRLEAHPILFQSAFCCFAPPPQPPLPAHPTRLCILLINLLLSIQHETTSEEGVGVAFDHDIMLQPWQQLS